MTLEISLQLTRG